MDFRVWTNEAIVKKHAEETVSAKSKAGISTMLPNLQPTASLYLSHKQKTVLTHV